MVGFAALGQEKADTVLAKEYYQKARFMFRKSAYDSTIIFLRKTSEIYKKCKLWRQYFESEFSIARCFYRKRVPTETFSQLQKIIKESSQYLSKENFYKSESYSMLGVIATNEKRFKEAIVYLNKCLEINKKLFGYKHYIVASSLNNLGRFYYRQERFYKALTFYKESLKIKIAVKDKPHYIGNSYNNIGLIYQQLGEYENALEFFGQAYKIFQQQLDANNPWIFNLYRNMAMCYAELNKFDKALSEYNKSLEIATKVHGVGHENIGQLYIDIADTYLLMQKFTKAIEYYNKALPIYKNKNNKDIVTVYNGLGRAYLATKDSQKAFFYLIKAQKYMVIRGKEYIVNLNSLGDYYQMNGIIDSALVYYKKGISQNIVEKSNNKTYLYNTKGFTNGIFKRIELLLDTYEKNKKSDYLNKTIREVDYYDKELQKIVVTKQTDQFLFLAQLKRFYALAIRANWLLYQKNNNLKSLDKCFYYSERYKATVLLSSLTKFYALKLADIPPKLLEYEDDLRKTTTYWKNQIISNPKKASEYQDSLFKYNRAYEALIAKLEKDYPKYAQLKYQNKTVNIAEVQQKLDGQTALLEYAFGEKQSYLMVITKTGVNVVPIVADKKLKPLMNAYYEALANEARVKTFAKTSYALYEALLKPAEKYLQGKKRLLVVAPSLESIPFESLISQKAPANAIKTDDYSQLNYLIKQYQVSYHYSATLWHRGVQSKQKVTPRLLALAPFSTGKSETISTRTRKSADPLPESGVEVRKLFNLFNAKKLGADVYLAKKATKKRFVSQAKDYSILHIASHSSASTKYADLAKIRFAPDSDTSKVDGLLYSGEVYNLSLNADLLVLSSCESGVGKLAQGEGVLSLARSFLYAGARNIVFSLWDVNDVETRKLMTAFYTNFLSGQNYREALQKAQHSRIKADKYLPPKHWAGFVMIGE
ncbi:hypothetical protein BKI52_17440 [marine bacterium AO1-C]|nr:hypothetical protein BKI52_17440 [marine bacterium AO1-C]